MKNDTNDMEKIRKLCPEFFSDEHMNHHNTVIETESIGDDFFVTSERPEESPERQYTIRKLVLFFDEDEIHATKKTDAKPRIVNVSSYGAYFIKESAVEDAHAYDRLYSKQGVDTLDHMVQNLRRLVGFEESERLDFGFTAVYRSGQGLRLICSTLDTSENGNPAMVERLYPSLSHAYSELVACPKPVTWEWYENILNSAGVRTKHKTEEQEGEV